MIKDRAPKQSGEYAARIVLSYTCTYTTAARKGFLTGSSFCRGSPRVSKLGGDDAASCGQGKTKKISDAAIRCSVPLISLGMMKVFALDAMQSFHTSNSVSAPILSTSSMPEATSATRAHQTMVADLIAALNVDNQ